MRSLVYAVIFCITISCIFMPQAFANDSALAPKAQGFISATQLKTYCMSHYDVDQGYCAGFITGVADIMQEHRLYHFEACNMAHLRPQQIVNHVKHVMAQAAPDKIKGNARLFVAYALADKFPCY